MYGVKVYNMGDILYPKGGNIMIQKLAQDGNKAERLFLSAEEVARLLGASKSYVYAMIRKGEIPSRRLGKRLFIPSKFITEFVSESLAS